MAAASDGARGSCIWPRCLQPPYAAKECDGVLELDHAAPFSPMSYLQLRKQELPESPPEGKVHAESARTLPSEADAGNGGEELFIRSMHFTPRIECACGRSHNDKGQCNRKRERKRIAGLGNLRASRARRLGIGGVLNPISILRGARSGPTVQNSIVTNPCENCRSLF